MIYLLISALVFLGTTLGVVIASFVKEELEPGREYFSKFLHGLYLVIILLFFYMNRDILFYLIIGFLVILFSLSKEKESLYYFTLAPVLLLSYIYNGFSILAPLAFLYGFPLGTLYCADNIKKKTNFVIYSAAIKYGGFLILSIALSIVLYLSR